jgi:hypothetical protein
MSAQMHRQEYVPSSPNAGAAPRRRPQSAQRSRADGRRYSVYLQKKGGSGLTLDALYVAFASFGMGGELCSDMDGAHFAKLCRDCNLIDHDFTLVDVDLIFSKVRTLSRSLSLALSLSLTHTHTHCLLTYMHASYGTHLSRNFVKCALTGRSETAGTCVAVQDEGRAQDLVRRVPRRPHDDLGAQAGVQA